MWKDQAKVWTTSGEDVTEAYKNGAIKAYQKLQEKHIDLVIMKEKALHAEPIRFMTEVFRNKKMVPEWLLLILFSKNDCAL